MPNRIWSDEKNDWIVVDDATNQAINVEVLDGKGYYRNPKLDEEGNPIEIPGFREAYNAYHTVIDIKKWNIA